MVGISVTGGAPQAAARAAPRPPAPPKYHDVWVVWRWDGWRFFLTRSRAAQVVALAQPFCCVSGCRPRPQR